MSDLATKQTYLAEAEAALHKLATGKSIVEIEVDGMMRKYNPSNVKNLKSYIQGLKAEINQLQGTRTYSPINIL